MVQYNIRQPDEECATPSYGDEVGPKIRTLKYLRLSSAGSALIPGAAEQAYLRQNVSHGRVSHACNSAECRVPTWFANEPLRLLHCTPRR